MYRGIKSLHKGGFNLVNYDGLYNKEYHEDQIKLKHFYDQKLHFRIIENGTVLPFKNLPTTAGFGGIVDEKGTYIPTSFYNASGGGAYTPTEEIQNSPATVVYIGMFYNGWGHCITDNLQRMWFFKNNVYQRYFKDFPIVFVPTGGGGN